MLLLGCSTKRRELLAVCGIRVLSGFSWNCSGARCTVDVGPGALPCRVDSTVNTLVLQRAEERFSHGVIVAYPGSTYRLPGPVFREGRGEAAGGVVAAPIGVEDRVVGERHVTCSHADGLDDERCLVVIVHRVA